MAKAEHLAKIKELPTAFVVFGATGDLARKKIFPSFFELYIKDFLPEKFKIIAAARTPHSNESFLKILKENIKVKNSKDFEAFSKKIEYFACDVEQNLNLDQLRARLAQIEKEFGACTARVYYMAVTPAIYEKAFENLGKNKLNLGCQVHDMRARIVVEKPFGSDYDSAQRLNQKLNEYFYEAQIFRIDHFLGKETVQNIFAFRFANEIFEPVWNRDYVDHVQITLSEYVGIDKRGALYEQIGALRDVVQNHMLQILSLVTMDAPESFDRESIRDKKLGILKNLKKLTPQEVATSTVRGQFEGYRQDDNVDANSQIETFAMVKFFIDSQRWQNVPFYFRTGKKLMGKVTSIILSFKEKGHKLFKEFENTPVPNHVTIQLDPTEGIGIRLVAKKPGVTNILEPVDMEFCYKTSFETGQPAAYERLLLDIILGDQTLFLGPVGPSWQFIDPIREVWDSGKPKLTTYKPGSWGPQEAEDLMEKDGRTWLAPYLTICKI